LALGNQTNKNTKQVRDEEREEEKKEKTCHGEKEKIEGMK
jgi:hypothetical protein